MAPCNHPTHNHPTPAHAIQLMQLTSGPNVLTKLVANPIANFTTNQDRDQGLETQNNVAATSSLTRRFALNPSLIDPAVD